MGNAARVLIAALLGLGIVAWCRLQISHQRDLDRWAEIKRQGAAASLSSQEMPPLKDAFSDRSMIRLNRTFPPDRDGVRQDLQEAIVRAPLASELWFSYAQNELFAGNIPQGRAALERSDDLDPFFPGQLLRSIQLWSLLGERDHAIRIARSVVAFGFQFRVKSATELSQMGVAPREIFDMVTTGDLTPPQTGELLNAIGTSNREQLRQILAEIPQATYADPQFRLLAFKRASAPLMLDALERIWRAESSGAQWLDGCLVENIDLQNPPFRSEFPLGWQPIPTRGNGGGSWVAPDAANNQVGSVRISFSRVDWGKNGPVSISYPFYQLPWDGKRGLNIHVSVRSDGGSSNAWIATTTRNRRIQSPSVKMTESPQRLSLYVPPSTDPEILAISLNARAVGESPEAQTSLYISDFSLEAEESQ
ncbi:hypothetical protein IT571_08935 [Candidatus Sumerlaeota bacterium]|nr:hypothetical protein [Candidatus Sumerlaeota bacterium]